MRWSFALLAQAALSAALVLPPGIESADLDLDIDLAFARIVRIPCEACPRPEGSDELQDLVMDFSLHVTAPNYVTLNSLPVFPLNPSAPATGLKAPLVPHSVSDFDFFANSELFPKAGLDYTLLTSTRQNKPDEALDTLELRIAAVEGKPVRIEGVRVQFRDTHGILEFAGAEPIPASDRPCKTMSCMMNRLVDKVKAPFKPHTRPCGKPKKVHGHNPHNPVVAGLDGVDMPPPRHSYHGHGRHRHHRSLLSQIIGQVVLPILVGIAAGMAVSAVALVLGHVVVMLARKFKNCKARRQRRREGDSAKGLLGEEEAQGEEPPAYEDDGIEVVTAEKE